jgi:hypothetical protein
MKFKEWNALIQQGLKKVQQNVTSTKEWIQNGNGIQGVNRRAKVVQRLTRD